MSRCLITLLVVALCWALPGLTHAEESYPSRPITLLVPYPAGGFIDVVSRVVAEGLRHQLKQQVVVLNRPGGNGKIALGELTRSSPDGYTFLVNNDGGIAVLQALDPEFRFDFRKDYRPVAELTRASYVLTTRPNLPVNDVGQLVRAVRRLIAQPEAARELGARARAHVLERYGLARFLAAWDDVLQRAVA